MLGGGGFWEEGKEKKKVAVVALWGGGSKSWRLDLANWDGYVTFEVEVGFSARGSTDSGFADEVCGQSQSVGVFDQVRLV